MDTAEKDTAPMIAPNYPKVTKTGKGARLVAGWQAVWSELADGEWHERNALAARLAYRPEAGDLATITLRSLMIQATQRDLFDSEIRVETGMVKRRGDTGRRTWIRRADAANRKRVESAGAGS